MLDGRSVTVVVVHNFGDRSRWRQRGVLFVVRFFDGAALC